MGQRILKLEDCIPVAAVDAGGFIMARDGSVTIGWELLPPREHSVTQEAYDAMVMMMASAFRSLPEWTVVHRQDIYSRRRFGGIPAESFLGGCYARHFEGRPFLEHTQLLLLTFNPCREGRSGAMKSTLQGAASGIRYNVTHRDSLPERLLHFESRAAEFVSVFADANGMTSRRLTQDDIGQLLDAYRAWFEDTTSVGDIRQEDGTYLEKDSRRMFSYSFSRADDLPGEVENTMVMKALSGGDDHLLLSAGSPIGSELECEHIVNSYILIPPQAEVLRELDRRRRRMSAMSSGSAENSVNAEGIADFISRIHSDSTIAVYSHMNLFVWGDRKDEMSLRGAAGSALSRMGLLSKINTLDMPQLWLAAMPGGEMELGEDNYMISELEQTLCLGINESFIRDLAGGALRICDRRRHIPVVTDLQEAAYRARLIENYNAFVLGPSGSGKSFFMNWYVRSCYDSGQHVFIIDKGDSYEVLCSLINEESGGRDGVYHTWSAEHPYSFNPFAGWREWEKEEEGSGKGFLLNLLKIIWTPAQGWDSSSSPVLEATLSAFLSQCDPDGGDPMLADYIDYLGSVIGPRIDPALCAQGGSSPKDPFMVGYSPVTAADFAVRDFLKALQPFSRDGRHSYLLNNPEAPDLFSSRFSVFEMDSVESQGELVYRICTLCIMNAFEKKMRTLGGFKLMVIEEAWKAIATPSMADYLRALWKTARKYHTSAAVVTQQLSDILSSDVIKDAILGNSPVKILLDQKGNAGAFGDLTRLMGLSPVESALLRSVGRCLDPRFSYREVFISLGGTLSGVYALEVSEEEAWAYESDKDRKAPLLERARALESMRAALSEFAEATRNQKQR